MYEQGNDFSVGYALGRDSDNRNNGWGNDWSWIIALALIGGLFGGGFGFGGGYGGFGGYGAGGFIPFELGKVATQADIASGFNNSAVLSSLNDLKLGQSSGFAGVQQTLCQGFNGVNTTIMQGFHGVDNAICNLGYQQAQGFNSIGHQISDCCCATQRAIDGVIASQTAQTQRLLDFMVNEKLSAKDARIASLEAQVSNDKQSAYLLDKLSPCPRPAYLTCNPNAPYGLGYGVPFGYGTCGASVQ